MHHLFREDGKILIVAMDHAGFSDKPLPGMVHPGETIHKVISGGADAILTTLGTARAFKAELDGGALILTVPNEEIVPAELAVQAALNVGADAIKGMVYPWLSSAPNSVHTAFRLGVECEKWDMPFLAETVPGGFQAGPEMRTPEKIAAGARIGAEMGGDFIKTFYTGSTESFKVVTDNCYVPVVILGGPRMDSDRDLLEVVRGAIDGGASGVAMGNNIWRHPHPDKLVAAIASIIHDDATVDQAEKKLK
jgi:DhnA family fructose-bisphosphate aldolase class Ia